MTARTAEHETPHPAGGPRPGDLTQASGLAPGARAERPR